MKNSWSQYIAEFIGTFFLVFFGCGSVILHQLNPSSMSVSSIPIIFGGVVSIMIYALGHISGAHFNPAVSVGFWSVKRFSNKKLFCYITFQCLGAIAASLVHCWIWKDEGHNLGATLISTDIAVGFGVEFLLSFVLMFVIISVATDARAVGELAGIAIGTTVALCAFLGGPLTGASMNPARTLGPALVSGDFTQFWVYIFAPILGAIAAAFIYDKIRCVSDDGDSDHGCC